MELTPHDGAHRVHQVEQVVLEAGLRRLAEVHLHLRLVLVATPAHWQPVTWRDGRNRVSRWSS